MADQQPILECENLAISYFTRQGEIPAVVDFNLKVMPGEAVGVVGESGCGKSTVALAIMCYLGKNGRIVNGSLKFKGRDMTKMSQEELRQLRGSEIAMVYQEPMASLNPALRIGLQLMEVPLYHEKALYNVAALVVDGERRLRHAQRLLDARGHQGPHPLTQPHRLQRDRRADDMVVAVVEPLFQIALDVNVR